VDDFLTVDRYEELAFVGDNQLPRTVREYREFEAGDPEPSQGTYERISELYGWPRAWRQCQKSSHVTRIDM
jgi:hypothetical protein